MRRMGRFALGFTLALVLGFPATALSASRTFFEDRFEAKIGEGWTWIRENPSLAGLTIAVVAFLEGLALVGS